MEKKKIRKMALMLAFSRILAGSTVTTVKADNQPVYYILDKNKKIVVVDGINAVISGGRTFVNESDTISIFDRNNTISKQYGADQGVFKNDFTSLIKNPYIWEEIQKWYPVEEFASYNHAMDFYKVYFDTINKCGCGYAAITDKVFQQFEGRETEFEDIFGYPMYTIDKDGAIDFNYEMFMLEFFNYSVLYPNYNDESKDKIKSMFAKSLAKLELVRFVCSSEYNIEEKDIHTLEGEELAEYIKLYQNKYDKYYELYDKWEAAKDSDESLAIAINEEFGYVKSFLAKYGIETQSSVQMESDKKYNPGDIIGSVNFKLYKEKNHSRYSERNNVNAHYVYVVSIEDGKVIVSSWGDRFIFDDSDAEQTSKFVLKITNK